MEKESIDGNFNKSDGEEDVVRVLDQVSQEQVFKIAEVDKKIFPDMPVEISELQESLQSLGVQIVLENSDGEITGYLTSLPHNMAYENLKHLDPELTQDEEALYIESIGILPEHRSLSNLLDIWKKFVEQAKSKGYKKVTGHMRVSQGLSGIFQNRMNARLVRRIENWSDYGEPFDYLELEF